MGINKEKACPNWTGFLPILIFMRPRGLEPPRGCPHQPLKLARLPFRHDRSIKVTSYIIQISHIYCNCCLKGVV